MRHRLADTGASFGWQANSRISSASKRFNSTQRTFNVIHPFDVNISAFYVLFILLYRPGFYKERRAGGI